MQSDNKKTLSRSYSQIPIQKNLYSLCADKAYNKFQISSNKSQ